MFSLLQRRPHLHLGIRLAILMMIGIPSVWLAERFDTAANAVLHTPDIQSEITSLQLNMHRAESAERGYLLTDQSIYLDDYRHLSATIAPMLATLKKAVPNNAEQQENIAQAASLVEQRLGEMNMNIELHIGGEARAAQDRVRVGMGRSEMESLGLRVERMLAEERRLLEIRESALQRTNLLFLVIGVLSAFLLRLIAA